MPGAGDPHGDALRGLLAWPVRRPWLALLVAAAATVGFGLAARTVRVDGSPAALLPVHDRLRAESEAMARAFGDGAEFTVGVFAGDVFAPATLAKVDELSSRLWRLDGVASVTGPTTLLTVARTEGRPAMVPLMRALPQTAEDAGALRAAVLEHPLGRRVVASADAKAAAIAVRIKERGADLAALDTQVRAVLAELQGPESFALIGLPAAASQATRDLWIDLRTLGAGTYLIALLAAALALRAPYAIGVAAAATAVGLVWSLGAIALTGRPLSVPTVVVPPLLVLIGAAFPLYLIARVRRETPTGRPAVAAALKRVGLPIAVAALAAAIGMAPGVWFDVAGAKDFALFGAVGVACMALATWLVVPSAIVLWPGGAGAPRAGGSLGRRLHRFGETILRRRRAVVAAGVAVVAAAALGLPRLPVAAGYLGLFDPSSAARIDYARMAESLAAPPALAVVVDGGAPHTVDRLDALRALEDLQHFIDEQPGVDATRSLLDYVALARGAQRPKRGGVLPATQAEFDASLQFDPAHVADVVSADFSRARIVVHTQLLDRAALDALLAQIDAFASPKLRHRGLGQRALFPRGVTVSAVGPAVLLNRAVAPLRADVLRAVLGVGVALFVLAALLFLSLPVGFVAVAVNAAAAIVVLGAMGWAGVSLDVVTAPVAPLVLGVMVGHTIVYLKALGSEGRTLDCPPDTLALVLDAAGKPLAWAVLALAAGLFAFAASHFPPVRRFGCLAGAGVAVAFAGNVLVFAARVLTVRIISVADLVLLRLGRIEQIPLFDGLRPFQAKLVVLSAQVGTAAPGEFVVRRGELRSELYLLLSGRADVCPEASASPIGTVGRGDVIGEMALVREQPRSADVIAREPTEYLVLDGGFLDRLRRQYPRTAATLLLNLSRILSDRLERSNARLAELDRGRTTE